MQRISHDGIQKLAQKNTYPAVSMYVSLKGDYYDIRDRLLGAIREARHKLEDVVSYEEARKMVGPLHRAIHDRGYWWHEPFDTTAALFLDRDGLEIVALPEKEDEVVEVGQGFDVTRLFEQLTRHGRFYTLLLTNKAAHLVQSDVQGVKTVAKTYPRKTDEIATADGQKNFYSRKFNRNSSTTKRYMNRVDKHVRKAIEDKTAPLIVVGLDKIQSAFRDASKYELLMPEAVRVNPDAMALHEVVERARPLAQQFYSYYERAAQDELVERQATDAAHVASDMRKVLDLLQRGKVRTLFINTKEKIWAAPLTKAIHASQQRGDIDLTNAALREALDHNTEIFHLPGKHKRSRMMAILR